MNRWVQRGLRTALLTGGLLAAGTGVAAAGENDLTADLLGATATVPVQDGTVLGTPVVTGTGEDLTVGTGAGDGLRLPVDTDTAPGTTVLGNGGVSAPVRVTPAHGSSPDPADGLTLTVPANTSGGGAAGTTVTAPVVTGDLGGVLDADATSGLDVDVDLAGAVAPGPGGSGVLLDLEDTVTIGDADGSTSPDRVLELPVGLDGDRPTAVALPVPDGSGRGPLSGDDVDVHVGGLSGAGHDAEEGASDGEPVLTLPIDTGGLLSDLPGADALTDTTVAVDLGGLLGGGAGDGSVVAVPVDEGGTGTGSDVLVRVTLPIDLSGPLGRDGNGLGGQDGGGSGDEGGPAAPDAGNGHGGGTRTGAGHGGGTGSGAGDGHGGDVGTGTGGRDPSAGDHGDGCGSAGGEATGSGTAPGRSPTAGIPSGSVPATGGERSGEACGTGSPQAGTPRPSSSAAPSHAAVPASAGALTVVAGLLLAAARGRLWRDRA